MKIRGSEPAIILVAPIPETAPAPGNLVAPAPETASAPGKKAGSGSSSGSGKKRPAPEAPAPFLRSFWEKRTVIQIFLHQFYSNLWFMHRKRISLIKLHFICERCLFRINFRCENNRSTETCDWCTDDI